MTEDDSLALVYAVLCLLLVASGLAARRIPMGQAAKMALAWVGIFGLGFALFTFRAEFSAFGGRLKSELLGTPVEQGGELRIAMADDGHFWTTASVNGKDARFLIDSGATSTTISRDLASDLGLSVSAGTAIVETANGTVAMGSARADFRLGTIERRDMRLLINDADTTNIIGMNLLSSLSSWQVEGSQLVLRP